MYNSSILCDLFKATTPYQVLIGGTILPIDYVNGSIVITQINSNVLSNANRDTKIIEIGGDSFVQQYSIIQNNYQIDLYRINPLNIGFIDVEKEAQKVREYLKSFEAEEYFKGYDIEILPCYSNINYLSELNENKQFVNRAFFEVSLLYREKRIQKVEKIDKIEIRNNLIIGGKNE